MCGDPGCRTCQRGALPAATLAQEPTGAPLCYLQATGTETHAFHEEDKREPNLFDLLPYRVE